MTEPQWIKATKVELGWRIGNLVLGEVHSAEACVGEACVIHNPTRHKLSSWPMLWRDDRQIVERLCSHGVGHPDPDQWQHWSSTDRMYEQVHGCCGCCV